MPTEAELLKEIAKLKRELAKYERKFIGCCNENVELRKRLAQKRVREFKHKAKII